MGSLRKWCEVSHSLWDGGHQAFTGQQLQQMLGAPKTVQTHHFWGSEFIANLPLFHIFKLKHYTVKLSLHSSEGILQNRKQSEIININHADSFHFPFSKPMTILWLAVALVLHNSSQVQKKNNIQFETHRWASTKWSKCWHRGPGPGVSGLWLPLACGGPSAAETELPPWKHVTSCPQGCI